MWEPRGGSVWGQERGGVQTQGNGRLNWVYTGADLYCIFDPGRNQFVEIDPGVEEVVPYDGNMFTSRTNSFNKSDPYNGIRGPFTAQAGLTLNQIAAPAHHIIAPVAGAVTTMERAINATGGSRRMYTLQTTNIADTIFSILVKKDDGSKVDSSVVEVGFSDNVDPLGADISVGEGTRYKKITDDGWYVVYNNLAGIAGAPTRYFWLDIKDGNTIYYEAPQYEVYESDGEKLPSSRILTPSGPTTETRANFLIHFMEGQFYKLPDSGWIGAAFVPPHDTFDPNWSIEGGTIVRWHATTSHSSEYHQIYSSSSQQEYAYQSEENNVSQAFLQVPTAEALQGVPIGMVATWGWRNGTPQFVMCDNGSFREIDTAGTMANSGTEGTRLHIAGSPAGGGQPDLNIYKVAVGRKMLTRSDCMYLSKWFEKIAVQQNTLGTSSE